MQQTDQVALSGIDQYRSLFTVTLTQYVSTIADPYALMVYMRLCTGLIGNDTQTVADMATMCHQTYNRFKASLKVLADLGYIICSEKKVQGRTQAVMSICLASPVLCTAPDTGQQPLFSDSAEKRDIIPVPAVNVKKAKTKVEARKSNKTVSESLSEWGSRPQIAVIDYWNELQGIVYPAGDPTLQAIYTSEVRSAKQIAMLYTHADLHRVWLTINTYKRHDRVTTPYLWRCLSKPKTGVTPHVSQQSPKPTDFSDFFNN